MCLREAHTKCACLKLIYLIQRFTNLSAALDPEGSYTTPIILLKMMLFVAFSEAVPSLDRMKVVPFLKIQEW